MLKKILLLMCFIVLGANLFAQDLKVALLFDGNSDKNNFIKSEIENQIISLLGEKSGIKIVKSISAKNQLKALKEEYDALEADKDVDVIVTAGPGSSYIAFSKSIFIKPTIAMMVYDKDFLPSVQGENGIRKNFYYISMSSDIVKEISEFQKIKKITKLTIISNEDYSQKVYKIKFAGTGIGIETVNIKNGINLLKEKTDMQAAIVNYMPDEDSASIKEIADILIEKKIPSYTFFGRSYVENGILFGRDESREYGIRVRKVVLALEDIKEKDDISKLDTNMEKIESRYIINGTAAAKIGIAFNWDNFKNAEIVDKVIKPILTLNDAIKIGIENSRVLKIKKEAIKNQMYETERTKSTARPELILSSKYGMIDSYRAKIGSTRENSVDGALDFKYVIFNDELNNGIFSQEKLISIKENEYDNGEIDLVLNIATSYYNLLNLKSNVEIKKSNRDLIEENLSRAKAKLNTGSAGPADVYRFEAEKAKSENDYLEAYGKYISGKQTLNNLIGKDPTYDFEPQNNEGKSENNYINENITLENQNEYEKIATVFEKEAVKNSINLKMIDNKLIIKEREKKSVSRKNYTPTIALAGNYTVPITEGWGTKNAGIDYNENKWSLGLSVSLDLFDGGDRNSYLSQIESELRSIYEEKTDAEELIKLQIRVKLNNAVIANKKIINAEKTEDAAKKAYDLTVDSYVNGVADLTRVLDAQNAYISARESKTLCIYDFMIKLIELERVIGKFHFDEGKDYYNNLIK